LVAGVKPVKEVVPDVPVEYVQVVVAEVPGLMYAVEPTIEVNAAIFGTAINAP